MNKNKSSLGVDVMAGLGKSFLGIVGFVLLIMLLLTGIFSVLNGNILVLFLCALVILVVIIVRNKGGKVEVDEPLTIR